MGLASVHVANIATLTVVPHQHQSLQALLVRVLGTRLEVLLMLCMSTGTYCVGQA